MKKNILKLFVIALVLSVIIWNTKLAYAVFIAPGFVVFDNNNTARVTLNNRSNIAKVLTFEWENRYFNEEGKSVLLKEGQTPPSGYKPLKDYVRYSPQRIILRPKSTQTVRFVTEKPKDLPEGEYRSHFLIKEQNLLESGLPEGQTNKSLSGTVSININKSIPVFLRHGTTQLNATITNVVIDRSKKTVNYIVENNSTRSVYGRLELLCNDMPDAKKQIIGPVRVFTERKQFETSHNIREKDANILSCNNVIAFLGVRNDFEYAGQTISQVQARLIN